MKAAPREEVTGPDSAELPSGTAFEDVQRGVFDRTAARYDGRWMRSRWPRNVEARVAAIEELLAPALDGSVVEIGCGTGQMGELLLTRNSALTYVGLDLSAPMLDVAAARMARFGSRAASRQVHGRLRLEPASFDGGFGVDVLHHVERPVDVLRDVGEALVPGGRMVFLEGNPRFPVTTALAVLQRHERGLLGISRSSLERWATDAGLEDVATEWGPTYTPPAPPRIGRAFDRIDALCSRVPGLRTLALHIVLSARRPPA